MNREGAESEKAASPSPPSMAAGLSLDGGRLEAKSHSEFEILKKDCILELLNNRGCICIPQNVSCLSVSGIGAAREARHSQARCVWRGGPPGIIFKGM